MDEEDDELGACWDRYCWWPCDGSQEDLLYTVVAYALGLFVVASFLPIRSWGHSSNPVICLAVQVVLHITDRLCVVRATYHTSVPLHIAHN